MPSVLKILRESETFKKVVWRDELKSIAELKSLVTKAMALENCFVGLFGVVSGSLKMLNSDADVREFLAEVGSGATATVDVYCTPLSRDETFITRDYGTLYNPKASATPSEVAGPAPYPKTDPSLRKTDFDAFKALKSSNFVEFTHGNYSPYHVIRKIEGHLITEGYIRLKESEKWDLVPGGKYYIKRGHYSAIISFIIPSKIDADQAFFKIVGTHCDSPCLRLCPYSKIENGDYLQLDVTAYGGALWKTWFDRELAIGGRVTLKHKDIPNKLDVQLYSSKSAFAYVPSLCPHLQNTIDETPLNPEYHLRAIVGSDEKGLAGKKSGDRSSSPHFDFILDDIATQLNVPRSHIVDTELCLADATKAQVFGPSNNLLAASKMDNTASAWAAMDGLIMASLKPDLLPAQGIPVMACFDHEEIGSTSTTGANSEFLPDILKRIIYTLSTDKSSHFELYKRANSRSYFISADMGHALNPNYREYFKSNYQTALNKGILVKTNDNLKYTSTSISRSILKALCEENAIPLQDYVGRNDKHAGSTIGPMLSSLLGIESVDIGGALLAMHSIRELAGVEDIANYAELFRFAFLANQVAVDDNFK